MPTYDYHCDACNHEFEEFQSISEPLLTKCPECGKKKLRRLFGTGAAILFKGSGFYETDYRSESYKQAAKADQEKASGKESSKENSTGSSNGTTGSDGTAKADTKAKSKKDGGKSSKS